MLTGPAGIDPSRLFSSFDLASRRSVIAAVSGGSDSTALLLLLQSHLKTSAPGTSLVAVTVDHRLRAGSAAEVEDVARLCERIGINHRTLVRAGPKPRSGVPAAARDARYELLKGAARDLSTDLVFTGHTADDQAETVSMRSMREAGRGLAGMAPATLFDGTAWIARPLLAVRRAALRDYLNQQGVGWSEDPTNLDAAYERSRVRALLAAEGGEARLAEALRVAEKAALQREARGKVAAGLIGAHADRPARGLYRLASVFLAGSEQDAAIYALRVLLAVVGGTPHLPDEARTTALLHRLRAGPHRVALSRTLVDCRRGGIFLHREARGLPAPMPLRHEMDWDGRYRLSPRHEGEELVVAPKGRADIEFETPRGAPGSLAKAALALEPAFWRAGPDDHADVNSDPPEGSAATVPLIAPWTRFLPSFDLAPAGAAAELVGAPEIPPPPFQGHNTRKA